MTTIVISSGHGKYVRGASGYIDEVDEARRVVDGVADLYRRMGVDVHVFHDDASTTQSENLDAIVDYHNSKARHLDISVHFNCYDGSAQGCEVLYVTQDQLASKVSLAIAQVGGFVDRGAKYRSDLAFLNGTEQPAILIDTCFVDSRTDTELYHESFEAICRAIAESTTGRLVALPPDAPEAPERPELPNGVYPKLRGDGAVSWFGGPDDTGVAPDEGLAFIYSIDEAPYLFLPYQPAGTSGLARRLDPQVFYIAMRWDYSVYPKEMLASGRYKARVRAPSTGREFLAWPADWGPHEDTDRVADISPGLMSMLGIGTDDDVEVSFPVVDSICPPTQPELPDLPLRPIEPPADGGWGFVPDWGFGWFPRVRSK